MIRIHLLLVLLFISLTSYCIDEYDSTKLIQHKAAEALLQKGELCFNDSLELSIEYALQIIEYSKENNLLELEARANHLYGNALRLQLDKSAALKYLFKARDIASKIPNDSLLIEVNFTISKIYNSVNMYSKALDYSIQALNIAKKNNNTQILPSIYNIIANYYYKDKDYEKTLEYLKKAYEGFISRGDSLQAIVPMHNSMWVYKHINDTVRARNSAFQILDLLSKCNIENHDGDFDEKSYYVLILSVKLYLGLSEASMNNFSKALDYTLSSIKIAEEKDFVEWQANGYNNLSKIYIKKGDYEKAFNALRKNKILSDSVINLEKKGEIEVITLENEVLKREKRIVFLENKSSLQKIYLFIALCFSFFIIMVFVFYNNRIKLKNKLYAKEKIEIDLRMNLKSREILNSSLIISDKIKIIKSIKKNVDRIVLPEDSESNKEFVEVKRKIRETIQIDNNWEKIKLHFQESNPTFFKNLNESHPSLSEKELKHCSYIILNSTSNEVAQLMYISVRSIHSARHKIKKKMHLSKDDSLYEELQKY